MVASADAGAPLPPLDAERACVDGAGGVGVDGGAAGGDAVDGAEGGVGFALGAAGAGDGDVAGRSSAALGSGRLSVCP